MVYAEVRKLMFLPLYSVFLTVRARSHRSLQSPRPRGISIITWLIAFEVRERNPQFFLGVLCIIWCPVQLIREVILRLHFRRHSFASV